MFSTSQLDLNKYHHVFFQVDPANPKVLTTHVYDNNLSSLGTLDVSFGDNNIVDLLTTIDQSGANPYVVGTSHSGTKKVNMDLAFFGLYNTTLTTTNHQLFMQEVNSTYLEPHSESTIYLVTVSGGKFYINGVETPSLALSNGYHVFDQRDSTNANHPLLVSTGADGSHNGHSEYTTTVIKNGTPGSLNAYTLIHVTFGTPEDLFYYCGNHSGMGGAFSALEQSYFVKVATNVIGQSVYAFSTTQTGTYYNQLDMSFNTGDIVNFDLSDPSNTGKSLIFGTERDNSGTQISSSYVTVDGNITKLDLTGYSGDAVYYFEDTDANMGYTTALESAMVTTTITEHTKIWMKMTSTSDINGTGIKNYVTNAYDCTVSTSGVAIVQDTILDGSTQYVCDVNTSGVVRMPDIVLNNGSKLTIMFWVKITNNTGNNDRLFVDSYQSDAYNLPGIFVDTGNKRFKIAGWYSGSTGTGYANALSESNIYSVDVWAHYAFVFDNDGSIPRAYKNGSEITVSAGSGLTGHTDGEIDGLYNNNTIVAPYVNANSNGSRNGAYYFYDYRVYNRTLTDSQVEYVYNNTDNQITELTENTVIPKIVTVSGSPEVFYLDGSANPTITFAASETYVFDQSDSSNTGHQIVFSSVPDDTVNILGIADGVTVVGTPGQPGAYTQLILPSSFTGSLYYYSYSTGSMGIVIDNKYYMKVVTNVLNEEIFAFSTTESGTYYNQLDLSFNTGDKVIFQVSDSTMSGHTLIFGTEVDNSGTVISSDYITTVGTAGITGALIFLNLTGYSGDAVYYFEDTEANMGYTEQIEQTNVATTEKLYNPFVPSMPTQTSTPTAGYNTLNNHYQRQIGALHTIGGNGRWIGNVTDAWVSLDLTTVKSVLGVLIQPGYHSNFSQPTQYVTTIEIHVSEDNSNWSTMSNDSGSIWNTNITASNNDPQGNGWNQNSWKMALYFTSGPINARYVRIYPKSAVGHAALRFGVIYNSAIGGEISNTEDLGSHTVVYSLPTIIPVTTKIVTVSGSPSVFYLDGVAKPTITFAADATYVFDQSDSSNTGHQIVFGTVPNDTANILGTADGVTVVGTPGQEGAYTQLILSSDFTGLLYYYCVHHPNMTSTLKTVTVAGSPQVFYIDGSANPLLTFSVGEIYAFDQSDSSNTGHQIVFGTVLDDTDNILGTADGVTVVGTPGQTGAYTQMLLPSSFTGSLYYYCLNHSNMGPILPIVEYIYNPPIDGVATVGNYKYSTYNGVTTGTRIMSSVYSDAVWNSAINAPEVVGSSENNWSGYSSWIGAENSNLASGSLDASITLDLQSEQSVKGIVLQPRTSGTRSGVSSFELYTSNNNINFTKQGGTIISGFNSNNMVQDNNDNWDTNRKLYKRRFDFSSTIDCRYVKLITKGYFGSFASLRIGVIYDTSLPINTSDLLVEDQTFEATINV